MTKVLLLNPPSELLLFKEDRCQNEVDVHVQRVVRPPISLMSLAAISEKLGFDTRIIDAPIEGINLNQLGNFLKRWKPDWVIANTSVGTLESDLWSLKIAKEIGAKTVTFGYAPTINDVELMQNAIYIDFAIRGEAEKTFQELIENTIPLEMVKGLIFRRNSQIQENQTREFIENLDELPFPAHHLIKNDLYRVPTTGELFTTIQTSKGCPFNCTFCLTNLLNGPKVRKRSVNSIIEELKLVTKQLHIYNFFFRADTFTFDKRWVLELCHEIMKNKLKIRWYCNSRVDTVDEDILRAMKRAGCYLITFGIESGNERVLKYVKKKITKDQAMKAIKLTRNVGILSGTFYILGLPGDSINSMHDTIRFSRQVDSDLVEFIPYISFSGTKAINQSPSTFEPSLLRKLIRYAFIKFYFRPKIVFRQVRNFIPEIQGLSHLTKLILVVIKSVIRVFMR